MKSRWNWGSMTVIMCRTCVGWQAPISWSMATILSAWFQRENVSIQLKTAAEGGGSFSTSSASSSSVFEQVGEEQLAPGAGWGEQTSCSRVWSPDMNSCCCCCSCSCCWWWSSCCWSSTTDGRTLFVAVVAVSLVELLSGCCFVSVFHCSSNEFAFWEIELFFFFFTMGSESETRSVSSRFFRFAPPNRLDSSSIESSESGL